ncbi:MAG: Gfo/Idh/MocA family protein, partial [Jatrophihabitans sp.]
MRIGLVGNGHWARVTHAAGLSAEPSVTFTGLWGRDHAKSVPIADEFGVRAYPSFDALLADVEAVAFSVPPDVQSGHARRAAALGKHLLLEKPIATAPDEAARLADAVAEAGVASVVFFTGRFDATQRSWLAGIAARQDWDGGSGLWLGSAFVPGSPFDTPWRHDKGGLWDVGPHVLSLLIAALGPIEQLTARAGHRDLVQLLLRHRGGALSSYALSIDAAPAVQRNLFTVWGPPGCFELVTGPLDATAALSTAARELAEQAGRAAPSHPCDVQFGLQVVRLLAEAEG